MNRSISDLFASWADYFNGIVLYKIEIYGAEAPLIILWLAFAAVFFTIYFRFINITGFLHAIKIVRGDLDKGKSVGEISHFQALATALSGTVGIGNIGGVAVVITMGGPGALFWLIVAGFLSMSTKFLECTLGVKYRLKHPGGKVSGGPMYYLELGLIGRGKPRLGRSLGIFYAFAIVIGCLGIGNMFQANQALEQVQFLTGDGFWGSRGWIFGIGIALVVGLVIIGGIKSIAKLTSKLVPFMALLYIVFAIIIIAMNAENIPGALQSVVSEAFNPQAVSGGMLGVLLLGFQRALFSNEAGLGSAAIAHSAVKTNEPLTEGFVALLEPFIDTVVICSITALVILTTVYEPSFAGQGVQGVELTASAFEQNISWSVYPLSIAAILFAFSTLISWSYYGQKAWTYLFGDSTAKKNLFNLIFCSFIVLGCTIQLKSVLDFSDAMIYIVAIPNIIGLYLFAPEIRRDLKEYKNR